jgi:Phospholipase_D-nuclease N-terminal
MLASTYPLLDIFWTMLMFLGFVVWVAAVIIVFGDLFRSRDLSGWAKALWTLAIVVFPLIGVVVYLVVRKPEAGVHGTQYTGPGSTTMPIPR